MLWTMPVLYPLMSTMQMLSARIGRVTGKPTFLLSRRLSAEDDSFRGIVSLTTRPGSDERTTQAEVSMIDGGLLAQGRISKKTKYMFGLRRSTIDFVLPSLIPDSVDLSLTTVPSYYDGQFRFDHELNDKWRLTLSSVGTIDTFEVLKARALASGQVAAPR